MNLHFDFAAFLIEAGADVDKWDSYGQTPLYVAIDMNTLPRGGRPDLPSEDLTTGSQVAEQLLAAGREPELPAEAAAAISQLHLRPRRRPGALHRRHAAAARRQGRRREAVALLLKYKANSTCQTPKASRR